MEFLVYFVMPFLIGAAGGLGIRLFVLDRAQTRALVVWVAMPLLGYTVFLALTPGGNFFHWWVAGMTFVGVPLTLWAAGAVMSLAVRR